MGNMLESDSSGNSDLENSENPKERTAGDGMESGDIINKVGVVNDASCTTSKLQQQLTIRDYNDPKLQNSKDKPNPEGIAYDTHDNIRTLDGSKNLNSIEIASELGTVSTSLTPSSIVSTGKIMSPRQLPPRDQLILVKPPKPDNKIGASGILSVYSPLDKPNVKQKNPKFVPYEPYSAAVRPIIASKTHTRKPSDTSSIVSQSSTVSFTEPSIIDQNKIINTSIACTHHLVDSPLQSPNSPKITNNGGTQYHHPSTTLLKERIKMADKEINDLQSENARLKKLLVDSMSGGTTHSPMRSDTAGLDQNAQNVNFHRNNECVDNLNDELEVWRSKFLSSLVLVEQLTKDNHDLKGSVYEAAEIIRDLKSTVSLTQGQYENINEWLRKTNNMYMSYSSSTLPDSNFCGEDYLDAVNN